MSARCRYKLELAGLEMLGYDPDYILQAAAMSSPNDAASISHVSLRHMSHETHIRRSGEDWAGVTDQKERKKRQNRLNQRAGELRCDETWHSRNEC